ncbi:MAG: peptidylprolyl isomerase, partial [Planctomycetota bacterium]
MKRIWPVFILMVLAATEMCLAQDVGIAQEKKAGQGEEIEVLMGQFKEFESEFREVFNDVRELGAQYFHATTANEAYGRVAEFNDLVDQGNTLIAKWMPVGLKIFEFQMSKSGKPTDEIELFASKALQVLFDRGQYEQAFQIADRLFLLDKSSRFAEIYRTRAGLLTNRFGEDIANSVEAHIELFKDDDIVSETEKLLLSGIFTIRSWFESEEKIRQAESLADDLPRVEFTTSQGNFIVELFENEAPESVASFIHLVENKFYDGLAFHTVIDMAAAETGVLEPPNEDGLSKARQCG